MNGNRLRFAAAALTAVIVAACSRPSEQTSADSAMPAGASPAVTSPLDSAMRTDTAVMAPGMAMDTSMRRMDSTRLDTMRRDSTRP